MQLKLGIAGATLILVLAAGGIAAAVAGGGSDDGPDDTLSQGEPFIGLTISEATALAGEEGRAWRIGRQDDEAFALTDDLIPGRVTFEIDDGTVTNATIESPSLPSEDDVTVEDPSRADLIAVAMKRLLTLDNGFGGRDVFNDVRVANVVGADPDQPLSGLDLDLIAATLSDLGAVRFVDDADAEIGVLFDEPQAGVAVVSVENILMLDDRAEIELRLWCGSLCGVFLTYEAVPANGGWNIVGIIGPTAMS